MHERRFTNVKVKKEITSVNGDDNQATEEITTVDGLKKEATKLVWIVKTKKQQKRRVLAAQIALVHQIWQKMCSPWKACIFVFC